MYFLSFFYLISHLFLLNNRRNRGNLFIISGSFSFLRSNKYSTNVVKCLKIESAEKNRMLNSKSDTAEIPVIENSLCKKPPKKDTASTEKNDLTSEFIQR